MLGLSSGNPLKEKIESLKFSNPASSSSKRSYNRLVELVETLEVEEPKWEKLLERAEGGEIDMVQVELLEKKMNEKHQKFVNNLEEFEAREDQAISNTSDTQERTRLGLIEEAVEDIGRRAEKLEKIIQRTGKAEEKEELEEIRVDLKKEKEAAIEELEELRETIS